MCDLHAARAPVLLSNVAFTAGPIKTIDDKYIDCHEKDGQIFTVVAGMQEAMSQAFESGSSVHAQGQPWSQEPSFISLDAFSTFSGPAL